MELIIAMIGLGLLMFVDIYLGMRKQKKQRISDLREDEVRLKKKKK